MFGRLLRVTGTVVVIAVACVTPVLATSTPASAAGAPGSWQTEQTYASGFGSLNAISCSSAADCTAVAGNSTNPATQASIVATTDGGATWTTQAQPTNNGAPITSLQGVSCASASDCTAVGYDGGEADIVSTTDGGATWTDQGFGTHVLNGVSCPSVSDCTAVGFGLAQGLATIVATTNGGATWTSQVAPTGMELYGVSCPSTSDCTAVGTPVNGGPEIATTTDGGATWTAQSVPSGAAGGMDAISCPSVSDCYAAGGVLIATTDGGTTWNIQTTPPNHGVQAVSCVSTSDCTAVGVTGTSAPYVGDIQATTDGGATWTTESAPSGVEGLFGVSCPAAGACTAIGIDNSGDSLIIGQGPTTSVLIPSAGATVSQLSLLDAGASSPVGLALVNFELSGGTLSNPEVISSSTPTLYGWIGGWNTTSVPNGTYTLQSVATDIDGTSTTSAPVTITVNNPPPSTNVLIPSNGATQSGIEVLDSGATADVTAVSFEISGNGLTDQVISSSGLTPYGWIGEWNTASVPNGTYTLQSVGTYSGGTVTSAPITITVSN